jgi:hypothetical protein
MATFVLLLAAGGHRMLAPTLTGYGPNVHMVAKGVDLEMHKANSMRDSTQLWLVAPPLG